MGGLTCCAARHPRAPFGSKCLFIWVLVSSRVYFAAVGVRVCMLSVSGRGGCATSHPRVLLAPLRVRLRV